LLVSGDEQGPFTRRVALDGGVSMVGHTTFEAS